MRNYLDEVKESKSLPAPIAKAQPTKITPSTNYIREVEIMALRESVQVLEHKKQMRSFPYQNEDGE